MPSRESDCCQLLVDEGKLTERVATTVRSRVGAGGGGGRRCMVSGSQLLRATSAHWVQLVPVRCLAPVPAGCLSDNRSFPSPDREAWLVCPEHTLEAASGRQLCRSPPAHQAPSASGQCPRTSSGWSVCGREPELARMPVKDSRAVSPPAGSGCQPLSPNRSLHNQRRARAQAGLFVSYSATLQRTRRPEEAAAALQQAASLDCVARLGSA